MPTPLALLLVATLGLTGAPAVIQQGVDRDPRVETNQARALEEAGDLQGALEIYQRLAAQPEPRPSVWVLQGTVLLRLGRIDESLAAFESAIAADPEVMPYLWQRGIAQYFAGLHEECARQFVAHGTVNPNDVENAAWHFLCVAADQGSEAAASALLPTGHDTRIPMGEIYELFAGRGSAEEILASASRGPVSVQNDHLFYALLYLGLYAEASGDNSRALEHLREANTKDFPFVMGDVARVALERMEARVAEERP